MGPGPQPECWSCGARLPSGAKRCHLCGAPSQSEQQQRRCPTCGTPAARQARTCLMCGAALDQAPARGALASVSWPWLAAVTLIVVLMVVGWNYWRDQPQLASAVPSATPNPTHTPGPTRTATPSTDLTPGASPTPTPTPIIHEVQSGDTLVFIAAYYGTTFEEIMKANGLDEAGARRLRPGQRLVIPSLGSVGGPVSQAMAYTQQVVHEVKSGETLISIAIDYDSSVEAILDANDLDSPDWIYEGQELVVPLMPVPATVTPTPAPTPSSTPGPPFAAPFLLSPADGTVFQAEDGEIVLTWTGVGILRDNQGYLVEVETPAQITPITHTTQGTSWRLPADLRPTGRRRAITWRVTVVERPTSAPDETPDWQPISLPSETRHVVWW